MITRELKNKVDRIWEVFGQAGSRIRSALSNSLHISYLLMVWMKWKPEMKGDA